MPNAPRAIKVNVPFKNMNAYDTKNAIYNLLDNFQSGGSFATSGAYSEAPLPDLLLKGFGPIPLPLAARDALAICDDRIGADKGNLILYDFGIGENGPKVDKSVSKESGKILHDQWEAKTDQVDVRNPAWNKFVQKTAVKACGELGVKMHAGIVKANFHKMHVWAVESSMPRYKATSVVPGVFGSLVICLPSKYHGGDLLASYGGQTKQFSVDTSSSWEYSYMAWYNNVTLEFKPMGLGYRLMLEYDLTVPSPCKLPSLANLYREKSRLQDILKAWSDNLEMDEIRSKQEWQEYPTILAYICDGDYDDKPLSVDMLEGNDRLRADCLEELCPQISMEFYLASLERVHSGGCDFDPSADPADTHFIDYTQEDAIILKQVVDPKGRFVGENLSIDEDANIAQEAPFDDGAHKEEFDHDNGIATHWYWYTALVMIPKISKSEWIPEKCEGGAKKRKRSIEVVDLS